MTTREARGKIVEILDERVCVWLDEGRADHVKLYLEGVPFDSSDWEEKAEGGQRRICFFYDRYRLLESLDRNARSFTVVLTDGEEELLDKRRVDLHEWLDRWPEIELAEPARLLPLLPDGRLLRLLPLFSDADRALEALIALLAFGLEEDFPEERMALAALCASDLIEEASLQESCLSRLEEWKLPCEAFVALFAEEERAKLREILCTGDREDAGDPVNIETELESLPAEERFERIKALLSRLAYRDSWDFAAMNRLFERWVFDEESPIDPERKWALLQSYRWLIDREELAEQREVRSFWNSCLAWFLRHRPSEFPDVYKKAMSRYLLDPALRLSCKRDSFPEELAWIGAMEERRSRLLELLGTHPLPVSKILGLSETMEGMAPDPIRRLRYALRAYEDLHQKGGERKEYERIAEEGPYGTLQASRSLHLEMTAREAEIRWIESAYRYRVETPLESFYREALRSRRGTPESREALTRRLEDALLHGAWEGEERVRLFRLLLSEHLWNHLRLGMKAQPFSPEWLVVEDARIERWKSLYEGLISGELPEISPPVDFDADEWREQWRQRGEEEMFFPHTLVLIYSCRAYEESRQRTIAGTWVKRLEAYGIGYRFVTGGAERDYEEGDRIRLAVSDGYRELPAKSVAMFRYAVHHTGYERFLKIDDDCFLNVDAYFCEDAPYRSAYYGRVLERSISDTDRHWHYRRSSDSTEGEIPDLSPEPSWYADGSTGYLLDRYAALDLVGAYEEPANRFLVSASFMEDKLVGDLLHRRGYRVEGANYATLIQRKISEKMQATFWEYAPYPRCDNRVKVYHSERAEGIERAWAEFESGILQASLPGPWLSTAPLDHFRGWGKGQQPIVEEILVRRLEIAAARKLLIVSALSPTAEDPMEWLEAHPLSEECHLLWLHHSDAGTFDERLLGCERCSCFVVTQPWEFSRDGSSWIETLLIHFGVGKRVDVFRSLHDAEINAKQVSIVECSLDYLLAGKHFEDLV